MQVLPNVSRTPKYARIAAMLRARIARGELRPGDQLPSFSEMRERHGASQGITERVYGLLEQDGLVERQQGRGTFVTGAWRRATGIIGIRGISEYVRRRLTYYTHLMHGFHEAAAQAGREVLLLNDDSAIHWEKVDGVIDAGTSPATRPLPPLMPCVSVLKVMPGMTSVVVDDSDGVRQAMTHLTSLGHRRIAYLIDTAPVTKQTRMAAYEKALRRIGVRPQAPWVREMMSAQAPHAGYREWGFESMRRWLREDWTALNCTALLAQNDIAAVGAIEALREAGLCVPQQVSVVGFDGAEAGDYFSPRLTTIAAPLHEAGATALRLLLRHIEEPNAAPQTADTIITLPVRLRVRASTAPPPSS